MKQAAARVSRIVNVFWGKCYTATWDQTYHTGHMLGLISHRIGNKIMTGKEEKKSYLFLLFSL